MNRLALTLGAAAGALALLAVAPSLDSTATLRAQNPATPATPATPAAPAQAAEIPADFKPLFEGITLTEVQGRQAVMITRKYSSPPTGQPDSAKPGMGAGGADRRLEAAKELRTILNPDQQKVFDQNLEKVKQTWTKRAY